MSTHNIIDAAMAVFRKELEDENQHLDDAVRVAIIAAVARDEAHRRL